MSFRPQTMRQQDGAHKCRFGNNPVPRLTFRAKQLTGCGMTNTELLEETILALVSERGPDKTICPSEAARVVGGSQPDGWGPLMQPIRRVAVKLAREGRIVITRKGRVVDPDDFRGIYRLGTPRQD
jgi:Protein of unknown function (DUF3253)